MSTRDDAAAAAAAVRARFLRTARRLGWIAASPHAIDTPPPPPPPLNAPAAAEDLLSALQRLTVTANDDANFNADDDAGVIDLTSSPLVAAAINAASATPMRAPPTQQQPLSSHDSGAADGHNESPVQRRARPSRRLFDDDDDDEDNNHRENENEDAHSQGSSWLSPQTGKPATADNNSSDDDGDDAFYDAQDLSQEDWNARLDEPSNTRRQSLSTAKAADSSEIPALDALYVSDPLHLHAEPAHAQQTTAVDLNSDTDKDDDDETEQQRRDRRRSNYVRLRPEDSKSDNDNDDDIRQQTAVLSLSDDDGGSDDNNDNGENVPEQAQLSNDDDDDDSEPEWLREVIPPQSAPATPKPARTPRRDQNQPRFIVTPSPARKPSAASSKLFVERRETLAASFFREVNANVFQNRLPPDMPVRWSTHLNKTAGMTKCKREHGLMGTKLSATIELSTKVVDSEDRMRETLAHEMCHAAVYMIDRVENAAPHGAEFYAWGNKLTATYPKIPVARCHTYAIAYKFTYVCNGCGCQVGRHSRSIDSTRHRCARCGGEFALQPQLRADGTPRKARPLSGFSLFVKENLPLIRSRNPLIPQKDLMVLAAAEYRQLHEMRASVSLV